MIETEGEMPEGVYSFGFDKPECGTQMRELYVDKQVDINNHEEHNVFIQDLVVNHLNVIKL